MSRALKVTHVFYFSDLPGRNAFSGAENHLLTLLPALARDGVDVELIALLWSGTSYDAVLDKLAELGTQGVRLTTVRRPDTSVWRGRHLTFLQTWAVLRCLLSTRRDRIVHLHLDYVFAPLVARAAGCRKIVLSVHCDVPEFTRPRWRLWLRVLDRIVVHYIAITSHVRDYYCGVAGVAPADVTTVYYGIDPPNSVADRRVFGLPDSAFVVGYVGRLAEQKNLEVFLGALAGRPEVLGVLMGDGPLRGRLESFARTRGVANVQFLGAVPLAAVHMGVFDLFCLPSVFEGLGLVLVEAMLARVPVAGSCRGAIPEVLGDGRFGLLFEPTADGLVAAIDHARAHPEEMRRRAESAYEHARTVFSVPQMVAGTCHVYRAVEDQGP